MDNGWTTVPATDLAPPLQQIKLIMIHITCILKSTRSLLLPLFFSSCHNCECDPFPASSFDRLRRTQPSRNGGTTPTPYFACESSATQSAMRPSRPHPGHPRREPSPLSYFRLWPPLLVRDVQAGFPTTTGRNLLVATRLNFAPTRGTGYKYCPHAIGYERAPSTSPLVLFY